ncbi:hypothetical protein CASFOL_018680 [Castilleja foliolosa]|uniref:DNA replication factor Cdt1 C-terminal domain-containing protein n=1 Tax=Castilleja foliolosa TaxID=1961234 RepID=A0ABD3D699_9LAMI
MEVARDWTRAEPVLRVEMSPSVRKLPHFWCFYIYYFKRNVYVPKGSKREYERQIADEEEQQLCSFQGDETSVPPPHRSLKFDTLVKSSMNVNDGIFDIVPDSLIQSIQEKEKLAAMEQDPAISQAKHRRKMIAGLPKRFDMIYYLFQSIRRSVVTKEELLQKIIFSDLKVSDRCEVEEQWRTQRFRLPDGKGGRRPPSTPPRSATVEEQLGLLQELVPEWISEKSMSSGDILICVNKISSPEEIRTRLSEAK